MGLAAIDCIQRAVASLRANWELVLVQLVQSLVVGAIALAGLLPPLAVVGFGIFSGLRDLTPGDPFALSRLLGAWIDALTVNVPALLAAAGATLVVWLLAFLVYCWFQGGIYGILAAADRQAPPGAVGGIDWFRTYSLRDLRGWGSRYVWRYFWFWNLALLLATLGLLASVGWIAFALWSRWRWGTGAALGIGCGGALPIAFGWVAFGLWANLAAAALAEETAGVRSAARHALGVLGKRLGAVLLIVLVFVAAALAGSLVFAPLTLALDFVLREDFIANLTVSFVLGLAQSILSGIVGIAVVAASIALVRSERQAARRAAALAAVLLLAGTLAASAEASVLVPERVRVGLATDLDELVLPCCGGDLVVESGGDRVVAVSSLKVEPAGRGPRPTAWRVQAAALKDEAQAAGLAERLAAALAQPAEAVFDAAIDLYRVRVGRFPSRAEAERARDQVLAQGVVGALVVGESRGALEDGLRVVQGHRSWRVRGRWLALRNLDGSPVRLPQGRFRGRILVFLNERGSLNLINELPLEEYLQGVVPQEMGPGIYGEIEALKAQAVAARSYAVRNLGEFAAEGYDLCATPRCQVYGGLDAEHELSNQAVAATAGEVLTWSGTVVDALYSSTCGGHTENVALVFPLKDEPYLRGVPCLEAGLAEVAGTTAAGTAFPEGLTLELLAPAGPRAAPRMLAARLEHLAFLAGLEAQGTTLDSLDRRAVQALLAGLLDLGPDSELFVADEDLPYLLAALPSDWPREELRLAAYLAQQGILTGDPRQPLAEEEIEPLLFQLALFLQVLERHDGRFVGLANGTLEVQVDGEHRSYALDRRFGTYRGRDGRFTAGPLRLLAGDRLTLYERAGQLLALVHEIDPDGVAFDRTSNLSSWSRFRSDSQLAALVATRYPGFGFQALTLGERGVSGRVGSLHLLGADGGELAVEGLAVRWTLDLPDTLFTARRLAPPGREAGWLFNGRGWGHGVGLCQVGAYGMAVRGHDYRDILRHYYSGVEIAPLEAVSRAQFEARGR